MSWLLILASLMMPMQTVDIWDIDGNYMRIVSTCDILIEGGQTRSFPDLIAELSATEYYLDTCFERS